jgi:hypothetical protein
MRATSSYFNNDDDNKTRLTSNITNNTRVVKGLEIYRKIEDGQGIEKGVDNTRSELQPKNNIWYFIFTCRINTTSCLEYGQTITKIEVCT